MTDEERITLVQRLFTGSGFEADHDILPNKNQRPYPLNHVVYGHANKARETDLQPSSSHQSDTTQASDEQLDLPVNKSKCPVPIRLTDEENIATRNSVLFAELSETPGSSNIDSIPGKSLRLCHKQSSEKAEETIRIMEWAKGMVMTAENRAKREALLRRKEDVFELLLSKWRLQKQLREATAGPQGRVSMPPRLQTMDSMVQKTETRVPKWETRRNKVDIDSLLRKWGAKAKQRLDIPDEELIIPQGLQHVKFAKPEKEPKMEQEQQPRDKIDFEPSLNKQRIQAMQGDDKEPPEDALSASKIKDDLEYTEPEADTKMERAQSQKLATFELLISKWRIQAKLRDATESSQREEHMPLRQGDVKCMYPQTEATMRQTNRQYNRRNRLKLLWKKWKAFLSRTPQRNQENSNQGKRDNHSF